MCPKGGKMCQMESLRLAINEHMTSVVGEDILCVLEKQQRDNKACCCVSVVRVFVLERLSAAAEWMCNLFQREMETLETMLDHQSKLLDMAFNVDTHTAGSSEPAKVIGPDTDSVCVKQEVEDHLLDNNYPHHPPSASGQLVCPGTSLVPEGAELLPRPLEGADGSTFTAGKQGKSEEDDDDEDEDTEPLGTPSTEHIHPGTPSTEHIQDGGTTAPLGGDSVQLISDSSEEWEEPSGSSSVRPVAMETGREWEGPSGTERGWEEPSGTDRGWEGHSGTDRGWEGPSGTDRGWEGPSGTDRGQQQRWFICPVCGRSFNRNDNLKIHMRIHTGDRPFSCPVCGKSFTLNENMKTHMRIHTKEKPFSCTLCDKSFVQKVKLKLHMTAHTGEKPFYCTVCGKSFNRTENLKTHMLTHSGEKPYGCTLCEQSFSQNSTLKRHMRTHTGEKPFHCTLCEQSFTVNHHLKRHMLSHTATAKDKH